MTNSPAPDAILLLAAGVGSRMGPLVRSRPKPLIKVAGRALIDHALDLTQIAGIRRRVVNAHYRADQIVAHLAGRDIAISHETPDLLETGGGLRHALPLLGSAPVMTLNTDAVWTGTNPLETLRGAWDPDSMDALLLLIPANRATAHRGSGSFTMDTAGRLTRGGDLTYTGAQILRTDGLHDITDTAFSLNRLWTMQADRGRLFGVLHPGGWCDVGYPEAIPLAEAMLAEADV